MHRRILRFSILAGALAFAACEQSGTEPAATSLSPAEVRALALHMDESSSGVIGVQLGQASSFLSSETGTLDHGSRSRTDNFTVTRSCPAGGTLTMSGQRTVTANHDTRTLTMQLGATKTYADCAFQNREGVVMTRSGVIEVTADWSTVNGQPGVRTQTHKGTINWTTSAGREGSCTIDLVSELNPATKTRTVKGTMCGRTVDISTTLN